jgi:hypothetical protein
MTESQVIKCAEIMIKLHVWYVLKVSRCVSCPHLRSYAKLQVSKYAQVKLSVPRPPQEALYLNSLVAPSDGIKLSLIKLSSPDIKTPDIRLASPALGVIS